MCCPRKVLGAVLCPRPRIGEEETLEVRAKAEHPVPVYVGRTRVVGMEGKFKYVQIVQVRTCVPREINADQGNVLQLWQGITENANGWSVRGNVEILHCAKILKVIQLEGLEVGSRRRISEVLASNLLACIVSNYEMKRTPKRDMGANEIKDGGEFVPAEGDARDVVLGCNSVDKDVEASTGATCAASEKSGSAWNMRLLAKVKSSP